MSAPSPAQRRITVRVALVVAVLALALLVGAVVLVVADRAGVRAYLCEHDRPAYCASPSP